MVLAVDLNKRVRRAQVVVDGDGHRIGKEGPTGGLAGQLQIEHVFSDC